MELQIDSIAPTPPPATVERRTLLPQHRAELYASGLTDATIAESGIFSSTDTTWMSARLDRRYSGKQGAALVFDYGEGYYRFKPARSRTIKGKPVKYESPKGQPNRPYIVGRVPTLRDNPAARIFLTEGEKKTLSLTQAGFACIGLVGVYGWKRKDNESLLLELSQWAWRGREVYIVFDSDITRKADVLEAESRLAAVLEALGARVRCVRLPDGEPGVDGTPTKLGADDYLVAHGAAAFARLVEEAIEPEPLTAGEGKEHRRDRLDHRVGLQLTIDGAARDLARLVDLDSGIVRDALQGEVVPSWTTTACREIVAFSKRLRCNRHGWYLLPAGGGR